jgi:FAD:protein FMN transferase
MPSPAPWRPPVSKASSIRTVPLMGTLVTIQAVGESNAYDAAHRSEGIERAFTWFRRVEQCCTRFDPLSELRQLSVRVGVPVPVSPLLYEAVQFAMAVAEETDGAFDPTVGRAMEARGFNRDYRARQVVPTPGEAVLPAAAENPSFPPDAPPSYRDVRLDPAAKTIALLRPLVLDLGSVAKGFAVDLAARELQPFEHFAINAGGDLYLGGRNASEEPWAIGIRHPRRDGELIDSIRVSNRAVCTSGDYERRSSAEPAGHHILDPAAGASPQAVASVTVVAPTAILADALATAAFVLGPADGLRLFERLGVDGLIISPALERFATRGMSSDYQLGRSAIPSHTQGPSHDRPGDSPGMRGAG